MYPLIMFGKFKIYTKCPVHCKLANTKTHMRDATECTNSIGYGLFAVIKAIFSNQNDFELIVNYIQTIISINKSYKIINKIEKYKVW